MKSTTYEQLQKYVVISKQIHSHFIKRLKPQVADIYPELTINVGTGPNSPRLAWIYDGIYDTSEYPVIFDVKTQFLWIHWDSSLFGTGKGFTGKVERI